MSLDKAIAAGKEKRQPYRRAKAVDHTCRNHGTCPWCRANRLHADKVRQLKAPAVRQAAAARKEQP